VHSGMRGWVWLRRSGWILFVALTLRLAVLGVFLAHNHVSWGVNEPGGIARAIVEGHGFSSAFHDANGPTAWVAPGYPVLLACIFRIFGVTSAASAVAAILLNVVFSSLTAVVLVKLGREQLGESAGIVAGWAWAIAPPLLFIPWLLWETCLSGLVLPFAFMTTLRLGGSSRPRDWAWCGVIWSFGALLNPAMLAPLPALAIDATVRSRRWKEPVLLFVVCLSGILPWTVRNFWAFGQFVPVRSNFWPEVYFGNVSFSLHPTGDSMLYQKEGEMLFAADLKGRVFDFVRSNPKELARLTGERILAFWIRRSQLEPYPLVLLLMTMGGLVQAWRRGKRWVAFASVLALYPLVYYVSYTFARYRYPIEPLMYLLAGYFVCELWVGIRQQPRRGTVGRRFIGL
jgi:hypothetical protein